MPNYCWNYVEFKSDDQVKLNELATKFKKNETFDYFTDFCKYLLSSSEPKKPIEQEKLYDYAYTYGTKWWDIHSADVNVKEGKLTITGDSAWSPPQPLIEQICIKFGLDGYMEYEEPGADFGGEAFYNEHGLIEDRCYEYQQWRYMNCDSKEVYFKEELLDCYECEDIEEFIYAMEEYYSWMSKEDKKLFIGMFKDYKASEE
tara:strand:- start:6865 stop:7470 length:606 start_codon:yes stop_codon:yes gene_type:complete